MAYGGPQPGRNINVRLGLARIVTIAELAGEQARVVKEEARHLSCYFEREGSKVTRLEQVPKLVQRYSALDAWFTVMSWHGLLLGLERRQRAGACARALGLGTSPAGMRAALDEARTALAK